MSWRDNLNKIKSESNMTIKEISEGSGIPIGTLNKIFAGQTKDPQISSIKAIVHCMGHTLDEVFEETTSSIPNIYPIETQSFPLLGSVACGEPIFADENLEMYVQAGTKIKADFCLRAKGDSMTGARIYDGDIVFVRRQPTVENGEIAVVLIEDEATLKRVHYDQEAGVLLLFPENPNYKIMRYSGEDLNRIRILGKAIGFQGDVK